MCLNIHDNKEVLQEEQSYLQFAYRQLQNTILRQEKIVKLLRESDKALKKDLKKYGIIEGVTDKEWYTNSFHVDVRAKVDAITKMNTEKPMFDIATGGRIFYSEIPDMDNSQGLEDIINQAMKRGLYYGVNFEKGHCYDCGTVGEFTNGVCSNCGSTNVLEIDRCCGYLGIKESNGETRYNDGKFAETNNRVKHYDYILKNGLED
jgi:ribonucleoside-triphosphate reductase